MSSRPTAAILKHTAAVTLYFCSPRMHNYVRSTFIMINIGVNLNETFSFHSLHKIFYPILLTTILSIWYYSSALYIKLLCNVQNKIVMEGS